jgi:hypothetical protein
MAQPLSVFFSPEDVQVQELIEEAIVPVAVYYTLESLKYAARPLHHPYIYNR